MKSRLTAEDYAKLNGKKWRHLNESDSEMIPMIEYLDDQLHKYVLVSGENYDRDSNESSTDFQTEDLIANPDITENVSDDNEALMLVLTLNPTKNYILLTEKVNQAENWLEKLQDDRTISIRYAFHKVKVQTF